MTAGITNCSIITNYDVTRVTQNNWGIRETKFLFAILAFQYVKKFIWYIQFLYLTKQNEANKL